MPAQSLTSVCRLLHSLAKLPEFGAGLHPQDLTLPGTAPHPICWPFRRTVSTISSDRANMQERRLPIRIFLLRLHHFLQAVKRLIVCDSKISTDLLL